MTITPGINTRILAAHFSKFLARPPHLLNIPSPGIATIAIRLIENGFVRSPFLDVKITPIQLLICSREL